MSRIFFAIVLLLGIGMLGCNKKPASNNYHEPTPLYTSQVETTSSDYIGKVRLNDSVSIRMLILKHCPDSIADTDASEAVQAVNVAASRGLTVQTIGNHRIDKEGRTERVAWGKKVSLDDLQGLKEFISAQMKVDAVYGDTLIVYTIGHGSGSGSLMRLGQREKLFRAIAEAAEENDQETFWWQLSCHAAAKLPDISTLSERQQELFAMSASSPANELSYFRTQGKIFSAVFNAMAARSSAIDPNSDEIITAKELSDFISSKFGEKRGNLVFAKSPDEPIFGLTGGLANAIPIRDQNNSQREYPRNYIPFPQRAP